MQNPYFAVAWFDKESCIRGAHDSYRLKSPYEDQVLGFNTLTSDDVYVVILLLC